MRRAIRFLGIVALLVFSGASNPRLDVPETDQISNWPTPPYWTPPGVRPSGHASMNAIGLASPPLPFVAISPCRIADTRGNGFNGQYGPPALFANATRNFTIAGQCGIPASAAAVSFNFAALNVGAQGDLRVFPAGGGVPLVSTLNYNGNTPNIANAAVVPLGTGGAITVQADAVPIDLIIDVNGYYDGSGSFQLSQSRRAILNQFWTPQNATVLGLTTVGFNALFLKSDGADVWVTTSASVLRVRGSDGKLLETWTGASLPRGVLVAMGRILVAAGANNGNLYMIDPAQPAGAMTLVATLGAYPDAIAFDGARVWVANNGSPGSLSIITPGAIPWAVTTVPGPFYSPNGVLYDGANVWVTDHLLFRLDSAGAVLQVVEVGINPLYPVFDGTNIWVPNISSDSVSVVRASTGQVIQTLTGNGLNSPMSAAFDGQRVLVTNFDGNSVSLWRATDLTPLGSFSTGDFTNPAGACSDGINFWVTLFGGAGKLARF